MIKVKCAKCNKEIFRKPCELRDNKSGCFFCSVSCMNTYWGEKRRGKNHPNFATKSVKCNYCKISFLKPQSHLKYKHNFCCQKHLHLWMLDNAPKGKNAYAYKHGKTKLYNQVRNTEPYTLWRNSVYQQDRYTCQECQKHCRKTDIIAHHKKDFAIIFQENSITSFKKALQCPELWDISNGITLCRSCHLKIHKKFSKNYR